MAAQWNIVEILDKMSGATFLGLNTKTDVVLKGGKKKPSAGPSSEDCSGLQCHVLPE